MESFYSAFIYPQVGNSAKRTPVPPGYFNADADADSEQNGW